MAITAMNPATGKTIKSYEELTTAQANEAIGESHEAWEAWRTTTFAERATLMKRAGEILRGRKAELAGLMAEEMGKPLKQGIAEAEKSAWGCEYFANSAEVLLAPETVNSAARRS
ncbi:MAG: aldehyde dehydrogenase family protein [Chloroflexota bacterium]